jgi:predicted nucleic-acid-binding protein
MMNVIVDTNIIVRYLTNDVEDLAKKARDIFRLAHERKLKIFIPQIVIAECVWVLSGKVYNFKPTEIADALMKLFRITNVEVENKDIIIKALYEYKEKNIKFVDCLIASYSNTSFLFEFNPPVLTWNVKDFQKLECEFYVPDSIDL